MMNIVGMGKNHHLNENIFINYQNQDNPTRLSKIFSKANKDKKKRNNRKTIVQKYFILRCLIIGYQVKTD